LPESGSDSGASGAVWPPSLADHKACAIVGTGCAATSARTLAGTAWASAVTTTADGGVTAATCAAYGGPCPDARLEFIPLVFGTAVAGLGAAVVKATLACC
jgi:hypothetical protein